MDPLKALLGFSYHLRILEPVKSQDFFFLTPRHMITNMMVCDFQLEFHIFSYNLAPMAFSKLLVRNA